MNTQKLTLYILTLLVFLGLNSFGHSVPKKITRLGNDRKINRIIKKGDYYYNQMDMTVALEFYKVALQYIPDNSLLNFKIGICYLLKQLPDSALLYFDKSYELDKNVSEEIHFFIGRSHQLNGNFEKAIEEYEIHKTTLRADEEFLKKNTEKYIDECKNAMTTEIENKNVIITNLGDSINTEYPEYSPFISDNGNLLIFTARRPTLLGNVNHTNSDYELSEDIYFSTKILDTWTESERLGIKFNSHFNNAVAGISPDGKIVFVYNNRRGGNIYYTQRQDSTWAEIKKIGKGINSKYHESSVSTTLDNTVLYFVSNRKQDNIGGNDIYYCVKNEDNKWSKPKNIGSVINSTSDEESVFISQDGNTLYFSSRGHNSNGGYDIFTSTKDENGTWSTPVNLGMPINTVEDDVFYTVYDTIAYYSTISNGAIRNFDVFQVEFLPEIVKLYLDTTEIVEIPLIAEVPELDTVPIIAEVPVETEIPVKPKTGREIPMYGSIHFDFDKSDVKNQGFEMLDLIATYLTENPDATIVISGHTDSYGSVEYNQILSEKRAKVAVDYLTTKSIDKKRITLKGFSELQPIDTNNTDEGRANNRRVDFEIIEE